MLVEDLSAMYKPIAIKEYAEYSLDCPPWPFIHFEKPASHTVFAEASSNEGYF